MHSFKKQLHRALLLIILSGVWASTTAWANDRDSLQKAHMEASVKLLNRAVTHNILKARTTAPQYLIDRLNYVSADTKAKIEQLQDLLKKQTGKALYVIITRSPDMLEEQNAATKFNQETKDFTDKVHAQSMLDENAVLLTINFVKSVKGKKVGIKTSYLQSTGLTVGNSLAQHKITENDFRTDLQTKATNLPTKDDYARALIYRVHQSLGGFAPEIALNNPSPEVIAKYEEVLNVGSSGQAGTWASMQVIELTDDEISVYTGSPSACGTPAGALTPTGQVINISGMTEMKYWVKCNGSLISFVYKGVKYRHISIKSRNASSCSGIFLGYYPEKHFKAIMSNPNAPNFISKTIGRTANNQKIIKWIPNPSIFKAAFWLKKTPTALPVDKRIQVKIKGKQNLMDRSLIPATSLNSFYRQLRDVNIVCKATYCWANPSVVSGEVNEGKIRNLVVPQNASVTEEGNCPPVKKGYGLLVYAHFIDQVKQDDEAKKRLIEFADFLSEAFKTPQHFALVDLSKSRGSQLTTTAFGNNDFVEKYEYTNNIIEEIKRRGFKDMQAFRAFYRYNFKARVSRAVNNVGSSSSQNEVVFREIYATEDLWKDIPKATYNARTNDYLRLGKPYHYSLTDLLRRYHLVALAKNNQSSYRLLWGSITQAEKAQQALPISLVDSKEQYTALFGTNIAVFNWMRYVFPELEPMTLRVSALKSSRKVLFRAGAKKNFSNLAPDELADIVKNVKKDGLLIRIINKLKPVIQKIAAKAQKVRGLVVFFDKAKGILSIDKVSKIKGGFAFVPQLKVFVNQGQRIEVAAKAMRQQINGVVSATQQLAQTTAIKIKETSRVLTGKVEVVFTQGKVQVREHLAFLTQTLKVKPEVVNRLRKLPSNMVSVIRNAGEVLIKDLAKATIARVKQGKVTVLRWVDVSKQKVKDLREIADSKFLARRKSSGNVGVCLRDGTCFVAGTLIFEAKTLRPIETIQPEDKVHSGNPQNCTQALKSVKATFVRTTPVLVKLDFPLEAIYATPEHPFFDLHNQQILAGNLKAGDTLKTYDGYTIVQNTRSIDTTATVYNFHVSDFHTYYVGKSRLWVHNMMSHGQFNATAQSKIDDLIKGDDLVKFQDDIANNPALVGKFNENPELVEGWTVLYKADPTDATRLGKKGELEEVRRYLDDPTNKGKDLDDLAFEIKKMDGFQTWKSFSSYLSVDIPIAQLNAYKKRVSGSIDHKKYDLQPTGGGPNNRFGAFHLRIYQGNIYYLTKRPNGKWFWNRLDSYTNTKPDLFSFVITMDGKLKIGFGHYNLSNSAGEVLCAGSLTAKTGKVEFTSNGSGHYLPQGSTTQAVVEEVFDKMGVTIANRQIKTHNWKPKRRK